MTSKILTSGELMNKVIAALNKRAPLSVISVGATESYAMAQYHILSEEEFMNHKEAIITNSGIKLRGFTFPNVKLRDDMIDSVRKADIVGYNIQLRNTLKAGKMTEIVFQTYNIRPRYIYDSLIRRVIMFSQRDKFKEMLRNRRIVLIGSSAKEARDALRKRWGKKLGFEIVESLGIRSYDEIPQIKRKLEKTEYDLSLVSAGVNAVILAPFIAKEQGKVAFDLGQGMNSLITKKIVETGFVTKVGVDKLMNM